MEDNNEQAGTVKSDGTLFAILEQLSELDQAGVTELGEHLGIPKSSVHKHLKTLDKVGYVINCNGQYQLSFKFLTLGGRVRDHNQLCDIANEQIRSVANETDRLVTFAIKERSRGVFTNIYNDKYGLRKETPMGKRFLLHSNAAGKAMLSELDDDEIEAIIDRQELSAQTENTIIQPEELFEEIDQIREQGFAISMGERMEGIYAISASVFGAEEINAEEFNLGAISLSGPVSGISKEQIQDEFAEVITNAASELALQFKYL